MMKTLSGDLLKGESCIGQSVLVEQASSNSDAGRCSRIRNEAVETLDDHGSSVKAQIHQKKLTHSKQSPLLNRIPSPERARFWSDGKVTRGLLVACDDPLGRFEQDQSAARDFSIQGSASTERQSAMPDYEVTFFKHVLSSDGHSFKAAQAAISVRADNIKEAEGMAMSRFACLRGIPDWNLHADTFEVATRGTTLGDTPSAALQPALPSGAHAKRVRRSAGPKAGRRSQACGRSESRY